MTEEEKVAAEAKAKADADAAAAAEAKGGEVVVPVVEDDQIKLKDKKIAELEEERDNYKNVALKRLGKLPGDADFMGDGELSVAEQIKLALLDKEIESEKKAKDEETKRLVKENSELKLALKNRPGSSIGSEGGGSVEVKDNVFSAEQIVALKLRATRLKVDPDKFVENAKKNFLSRK